MSWAHFSIAGEGCQSAIASAERGVRGMRDEELNSLDEGLRRLKIEYHIFFHGNQAKAPDELRLRIERLVKKLSESADLSFSQRFRFNTVARYYVYRDLRRSQQEREMRRRSKRRRLQAPQRATEPALRSHLRPGGRRTR